MSKKLTLIAIPSAALLTFLLSFGLAWVTRPDPPAEEPAVPVDPVAQAQLGLGGSTGPVVAAPTANPEAERQRQLTEQQLRDLVREVRDRIQEYETKLKALEVREQRLATSQDGLQEDLDALNSLRVDVAAAVAELKKQRQVLEDSRIRIAQSESENLLAVSQTLAGMDADSAGQLVVNICQNVPTDPGVATDQVGQGYAVKLLHLMDGKKRAKLFVSLVSLDPDLAGQLSVKLKRILEVP